MKMGVRMLFPGRFGRILLPITNATPIRWKSSSSRSDLVKSVQVPIQAEARAPMNSATFRSVFVSAPRDRYKHLYRWDWHLRKLLYALMPPAAAYAYVCFLEWYMADEVAAFREMVAADKASKNVEAVKVEAKSLEQRVKHVENYMLLMEEKRKRDEIVDKARLVFKQQRRICSSDADKAPANVPMSKTN